MQEQRIPARVEGIDLAPARSDTTSAPIPCIVDDREFCGAVGVEFCNFVGTVAATIPAPLFARLALQTYLHVISNTPPPSLRPT